MVKLFGGRHVVPDGQYPTFCPIPFKQVICIWGLGTSTLGLGISTVALGTSARGPSPSRGSEAESTNAVTHAPPLHV